MKGSIKKRGNYWEFVADIGPDPKTGKRRQKSKGGFATKKAAETACAEMLVQLAKGTYIEEKNITVGEFAQSWINEYELLNDVKVSSVRQRKLQLRYLVDRLGALRLRGITRKVYQDFVFQLHNHGFARTTLQNAHSCYKLLFARALEQELIATDPTMYAKMPKRKNDAEETVLPRYMEKDVLMRFLTAADTFPDITGLAFWVLGYTGLRIGELCVLQWKDINFEDGTLSVRRTLYNRLAAINCSCQRRRQAAGRSPLIKSFWPDLKPIAMRRKRAGCDSGTATTTPILKTRKLDSFLPERHRTTPDTPSSAGCCSIA
jgi:integrase